MSDQSVVPGKPSLTARIDREKSHPLAWKTVAKRAAVVVVAGLAIYLVFPAITEVLASWPRLSTLNPWWLIAAIGAEIAHFTCTFALQRLALRTRAWFPVITSQLAGNAITLVMPGGAAVGAAVQFRMLAASGMETSETVGGLAAFSLLGVGGLLALPFFALPVILIGAPVARGLEHAAFLGAAGFVAFAAFGAVVLVYDPPLRWTGRAAQWLRNLVLRKRPPLHGLDDTLLEKRDEIRATLGRQWWQALLLSAGRLDGAGQPLPVREQDHPVLVALPDGDRCRISGHRRRRLPAQGEAPVLDERQVVVAPARDARAQRGAQAGRDVVGEFPGEHGPVGLDHQAAQRGGHALTGDGAHHGRLAAEELGQRGLVAQRRAEFRDVLRPHAAQPVQAVRRVRRHPGDRPGGQASPGQGRGAGRGPRPPAASASTGRGRTGCPRAARGAGRPPGRPPGTRSPGRPDG